MLYCDIADCWLHDSPHSPQHQQSRHQVCVHHPRSALSLCVAHRDWYCCVRADDDSDSPWRAHAPSCDTCPTARNIRKNWQPHLSRQADCKHCQRLFAYSARYPCTEPGSDKWPKAAGRQWTATRRQSVWWSPYSPAKHCPLCQCWTCAVRKKGIWILSIRTFMEQPDHSPWCGVCCSHWSDRHAHSSSDARAEWGNSWRWPARRVAAQQTPPACTCSRCWCTAHCCPVPSIYWYTKSSGWRRVQGSGCK